MKNNCLLTATNIVKNSDKSKYVYSGYEIAIDGKREWNFGNDSRNFIIFVVDNSSSSHDDNCENNFLVLRAGTYGINGSFGAPDKKFSINFSKGKTKICFKICITIMIIVICWLTEKKIHKFKEDDKNVKFPTQFCLGNISNKFDYVKPEEVSLTENVYDFSIDYNAILNLTY